jgi:hypothetical protein
MRAMSVQVPPEADRTRLVARLRAALLRRESPRWTMTAIVVATGASGFLASVLLLRAGLERIPVRYLAAVGIAYAVFLGLLYLWIRHRRRPRKGVDLSALDLSFAPDLSSAPSGAAGRTFAPAGGQFSGAGASGSWNAAAMGKATTTSTTSTSGVDLSFDLDDAGVLLALAAAAAVLLGASIFVVATAPTLFAELLLDGVLSASLYRRLRHLPRRHWLESAVRRTAGPFALAALLLVGAGWAMERYAPEAKSLGGVWSRLRT